MPIRTLRFILVYGLLFILLALGVFVVATRVFSIQVVTVVSSSVHVEINKREFPESLLFFPSGKMRAQILATNPILADIRFTKSYPHTLIMTPVLRKPVALLATPARRVFIDAIGYVLSDETSAVGGLPVITAPISGLRIGQKVTDSGVVASLTMLTKFGTTLPLESLTVSEDGDITAHTEHLDILFTQDENTGTMLTTLQILLSGFRIKGTLPKVIDLRFDKPVVTF